MYILLKPLFSRHKGIGVQFTDEPTGNLDTKSGQVVIDSLVQIHQKFEKTIIMVTHNPQMASYCEKIIFLKDGMVMEEMIRGETQEVLYQKILEKMKEL